MPLTKVSSGVIAANAVVDSFGTQSITGDKLGLTAINANNIVGGAVTGDKLGATSINANNIVNATITGAKLVANTVSGDVIGQNAISSNNIVSVNASVATVGTLPTARLPSGTVLRVVSNTKTDTFSTTASSFTDVTGLFATITPTSATSRILVILSIAGVNGSTTGSTARIARNGTGIGVATSAGSRNAGGTAEMYNARSDSFYTYTSIVLDSPATTSTITYSAQIIAGSGGAYTTFVNSSSGDGDNTGHSRGASSITVMEIAA